MYSGTKILRPIITYPLEFTRITAEISNKQNVIKSSCPSKMLWVELIMFFQPERNKNRVIKRKVKYKISSGAQKPRQFITYLLDTSWITLEVPKERFLLY